MQGSLTGSTPRPLATARSNPNAADIPYPGAIGLSERHTAGGPLAVSGGSQIQTTIHREGGHIDIRIVNGRPDTAASPGGTAATAAPTPMFRKTCHLQYAEGHAVVRAFDVGTGIAHQPAGHFETIMGTEAQTETGVAAELKRDGKAPAFDCRCRYRRRPGTELHMEERCVAGKPAVLSLQHGAEVHGFATALAGVARFTVPGFKQE